MRSMSAWCVAWEIVRLFSLGKVDWHENSNLLFIRFSGQQWAPLQCGGLVNHIYNRRVEGGNDEPSAR